MAQGLFAAPQFSDAKLSPRNAERPLRRATQYIILHTTEAPTISSLNKLSANGECHYLVDTRGKIYRIVDVRKTAYHCGLSMWNNQTKIDEVSVGIEITGYHDKPLTQAQYESVKELVRQLKSRYKLTDDRVLPHSMVAYGNPNKWQPKCHRGRKRCGMFFAQDNIRRRLGLTLRPKYDPDVRAGRLRVADAYLESVLFKGRIAVNDSYSSIADLESPRIFGRDEPPDVNIPPPPVIKKTPTKKWTPPKKTTPAKKGK